MATTALTLHPPENFNLAINGQIRQIKKLPPFPGIWEKCPGGALLEVRWITYAHTHTPVASTYLNHLGQLWQ